jgi:hypothetical protein
MLVAMFSDWASALCGCAKLAAATSATMPPLNFPLVMLTSL